MNHYTALLLLLRTAIEDHNLQPLTQNCSCLSSSENIFVTSLGGCLWPLILPTCDSKWLHLWCCPIVALIERFQRKLHNKLGVEFVDYMCWITRYYFDKKWYVFCSSIQMGCSLKHVL